MNKGYTELIQWKSHKHAQLLIYEDDMDIPYGQFLSILKSTVKFALSLVPGVEAVNAATDVLQGAREAFTDSKVDKDELIQLMDGLGNNDVIDLITVSREETRKLKPGALIVKPKYSSETCLYPKAKNACTNMTTVSCSPLYSLSEAR